MVLGKLPVPGRPTYLDSSRARAYNSRCCLDIFLSSVISLFTSLSLGDARYRLKYCLKWLLVPKQPINQN